MLDIIKAYKGEKTMVLMQEDKMIAGLVPEEGGGGHVIQNASGTAVAQEPNMQFADSHVSDDSTNEKTVIENIKSVTEAQFESATEDGLYDVDVEGAEIGEISEDYVEVEASGNKTWGQLLSELYTKIDTTKVNKDSIFVVENPYGNFVYYADCYNNEIWLCRTYLSGTPSVITYDRIRYSSSGTPSVLNAIGTNAPTDITSQNVDNGTKITLYYGNKKAVVDLQTTANRCLLPSGVNVKETLVDGRVLIGSFDVSDTDAHSITLSESVNHFAFVEVCCGWQSMTHPSNSKLYTSIEWAIDNENNYEALYLNNDSANDYVRITNRSANGATMQSSNSYVKVNVYGYMRISR